VNDTIACPNCAAQLQLPGLAAGQTVQCPRCQHVFEPAPRDSAAMPTAPILRRRAPEDYPEEPIDDSTPPRYQPLLGEWKSLAAVFVLAASVLSYGLQFYVNYEQHRFSRINAQHFLALQELRPMDAREIDRQHIFLRDLSAFAYVTHLLTYWPGVVIFLIWFHQAASSARILHASGLMFTPAKAVFAFFIPFANVIMPYQIMQEIWRASDPNLVKDPRSWQQSPNSWLVWAWWIALVAAALLRLMNGFASRDADFHGERESFWLSGGSNLCMIAAGMTLIAVIHQIRQRQRARHAKIYDEVA
jgi:hypothetical protein